MMRGLYSFLLSFVIMVSFTFHVSGLNVLIVDATAEPGTEFQSLSGSVNEVQGQVVTYTQVATANLGKDIAGGFDIVWLGWNATSDDGAFNRDNDADLIADYVEAGGILIASASDNNGWKSDWLPAAVTVLDTGDYDLDITDEGKDLFNEPNSVKPADPIMDERYSAIDKAWTVLAWGAGMKDSEAGVIQIAQGKGLYLMASIDTRNSGNTQAALPLMENMLNYAVTYSKANIAVESGRKIATTWAAIKQ